MMTAIHLLFIEDKREHIDRILTALREAGVACTGEQVKTEFELLARLATEPSPDIVLTNCTLREMDSARALVILREHGSNIPVIVIGGTIGEEAAVEWVRQGAVDYVHLDRLTHLDAAIGRALSSGRASGTPPRVDPVPGALSELNYRTLFEQSQDVVFITSPEGVILDCSQAVFAVLGYCRDELVQSNATDLYAEPGDRSRFRQQIEATGFVRDYETKLTKKDGSVVICWLTATLRRAKDGTLVAYEGILRNLTERVQAEAALRRSEARVRAIIDTTPAVAVEIYDQAGRVIYWNHAATHMYGFSQEEALGKTLDQLILDDTTAREFQDTLTAIRATGQPYGPIEWKFTAKSGQSGYTSSTVFSIPSSPDSPEFICMEIDITERKQAQAALQQTTEELEQFFFLALDLLCIATTDGYFLRLNREWERTLGYRLEDLEGKRFLDLVHPDDLESTLAAIADLASGQHVLNFTNRYRCQDGSYRCLEWRSAPYQDKFIYAAARDITERQQTEETLRISEEKFYKAFHTNPDSININRLSDGQYVDINDGFTQLTGYTRADVIGKSSLELGIWVDSEDRARLVQGLRERGEVQSLEAAFRRKDGSIGTGLMSARTIEINGELCILSITHDVTERMRVEVALRESERKLRSLVEQSIDGIGLVDGTGLIAEWNHGLEQITGLKRTDVLGKPAWTVVAQLGLGSSTEVSVDEQTRTAILEWLQTGQMAWPTPLSAYRIQRPDGSCRVIEASVFPIKTDQGFMGGAIVYDITERVEAQEALQRREALLDALASISQRFLQATNPLAAMPDALAYLGKAVGVSRVQVYRNFQESDGTWWTRGRYEWLAPGIAPAINAPERQRIPAAAFEGWYERLAANQTVSGLTRDFPPSIRAFFEPYGTLSLIVVPILLGETMWGLLAFGDCQTERRWLPMEIEAMHSVASSLGAALLRQQVETAEHDQRILAEALRDTAAVLTSTLDPEAVMARILDNVGRVVPHDAANIMLVEGNITRAIYWRGYTDEQPIRTAQFSLDVSNFRQMIETGLPYVIPDTRTYPGWQALPEMDWILSNLGAPLRARGIVIGFLNLDSATPGFFTGVLAARLQAFADQAAVAIENAQLFTELRRYAATLEQRVGERTAELAQERSQLQTILDAMAEGVVYTDLASTRTQYANPAFYSLSGYQPHEIVGQVFDLARFITALADKEKEGIPAVSELALRGSTWQRDARLRCHGGREIEVSVTVSPVSRPDGQIMGAVALFRDISKARALQAQKDRFIANAAHELRTPVTNLKMRLYLAQRQPEQVLDHLAGMEKATQHLTHLVEALLDVSRFERGRILLNRQPVVLNDLIARVVEEQQPQAAEKGIQLTGELPNRPVNVQVDPDRVLQVVNNLVGNAINYTPEGGLIRVQLAVEERDTTACAVLQIHDTGIGIPPEALPHLFEPFFRAAADSTKGTGLGLTITKEIVELHGGHIEVESQIGIGSTFRVSLPLDTQIC